MKLRIFLFYCAFAILPSAGAQSRASEMADAAALHRAEKALTDVIVHDIFSPPVASRIYTYANIAAYEVLVKGSDSCVSLVDLVAGFPVISAPEKEISFPLAAVYSFLLTGKKLVFSEPAMQDSMNVIMKLFRNKLRPAIYKASVDYGNMVSNAIMAWVVKDHYGETRKLKRYEFKRQEGRWIPTPPAYMAAIEPYWNKIRPFILDSASQFKPDAPDLFSKENGSAFYKLAFEVYQTGKQLNKEQKDIANFWDCNPFFLNTEGHLNFAFKKISPGGHWISITGILCRQFNLNLMKAAATYTFLSIAMFDAFISCWDEKYRSNVIRPETYINSNIDESWRPLLQTPPFPEYPSGHSVVSTAASVVLSRLFGNKVSFTDNSEIEFGLPARKFSSIGEASKEAAISRLYGGIHYRPAIENGMRQGESIGKLVVEKIIDHALRFSKL